MVEGLQEIAHIKDWREIKNICKALKILFRATSQKVFKGRGEHQKKQFVKEYLQKTRLLKEKIEEVIKNPSVVVDKEELVMVIMAQLEKRKL